MKTIPMHCCCCQLWIVCAKQAGWSSYGTLILRLTLQRSTATQAIIALDITRFSKRIKENRLQQLPTLFSYDSNVYSLPVKNTRCVAYLWDGARPKWPSSEDDFMPQSFGNYLCSRWLQLLCTRCCPLNRQGPQINGKLAKRKKSTVRTTSETITKQTSTKYGPPTNLLKTWRHGKNLSTCLQDFMHCRFMQIFSGKISGITSWAANVGSPQSSSYLGQSAE